MAAETLSMFAVRTAGSLEGLTTVPLDDLAAQDLAVTLSVIGDGVRLDLPLPEPLRAQLRGLPEERLLGAVASLAELPASWSLPVHPPAEIDDDAGLAWALRQRDEIESALVAARAFLAPRRAWLDTSSAIAPVREALARTDLTCGGQVSRRLADALLGERLEIAAEAAWLEEAPWGEETADAPTVPEVEAAMAGVHVPGLRALEAYVTRGQLSSWIEAAAARSPELADDLGEMIRTYREQKAQVSLVARRWERARSAKEASTVAEVFAFARPAPNLVRAAADEGGAPDESRVEHELGRLAPLDAEATLFVTERDVLLHVFEGDTPLASVQLGESVATRGQGDHLWSVTILLSLATPGSPMVLVAVDTEGRRFEAAVALEPAR